MKKLLLVFPMLFLFSFISTTGLAQKYWGKGIKGEGAVIEKQLDLEQINSFSLNIPADLILKKGNSQKVVIEGQENIIENIKTNVKHGSWKIKFHNPVKDHKNITIYITLPEIENISLGGSGSIISEDVFNGDEFNVSLGGSGNIHLQLEANHISASIGGSGNIELAGQSDEFNVSVAGSGDVRALDMKTNDTKVSIAGSGDVEITVSDQLKVSCVGSGDVKYAGSPEIKKSVIGSGDVKKIR